MPRSAKERGLRAKLCGEKKKFLTTDFTDDTDWKRAFAFIVYETALMIGIKVGLRDNK